MGWVVMLWVLLGWVEGLDMSGTGRWKFLALSACVHACMACTIMTT